MNNEIWFERVLWSYVPCHWKGWAVLFTVVSMMLVSIATLAILASALDEPSINQLDVPIFAIGLIVMLRISRRQSKRQG